METPLFLALAAMLDRRRSVSKVPGKRKLMVTLDAATERATPARNAVSPARAPGGKIESRERHFHRARCDIDDAAEFLARPWNRSTFWVSSMATIILAMTPSIICVAGELTEVAKRRARIVVDENVRLRAGLEKRGLTSGVATSAWTGTILAPLAARSSPPPLRVLRRRVR